MARAKFTITNKIDRNNFLMYLERNQDAVLDSLRSLQVDGICEEFVSFWKRISSPIYIRDTEQVKIWEDTTKLLYMLPSKKIETVKVSLRAKKRSSSAKKKTQLTIDTDVYTAFSFFAKQKGVTLSEALNILLEAK